MRSFFGSILLILVLAALGATIYYHWSTNSHLEFSATPTNRKKRHRSSTWKNGRQPCRLFRRNKLLFSPRKKFPLPLPECRNPRNCNPSCCRTMKPVIGYTLGDQSGIGPEVISAALASGELPEDAEYRLIGKRVELPPGRPNAESAKHAFDHLEQAAHALRDGTVDAVVTAPVCKETLHEAGFRWPGQTEFFAERLKTDNYAMCLTGKRLTVGLATIHTSLQSVPSLLETEELVRIGTLLKDFCIRKGIMRPRIALAALNPHAGEHGAFGDEDGNIIAPAVGRLRAIHPDAAFDGPSVPDCVYRDAVEGNYDAVLAPYHDQGLIPLKLVDFHTAVNVTLGLPRPRLSPDHGTAFNLAGTGKANPSSTIHAFQLAVQMARRR